MTPLEIEAEKEQIRDYLDRIVLEKADEETKRRVLNYQSMTYKKIAEAFGLPKEVIERTNPFK